VYRFAQLYKRSGKFGIRKSVNSNQMISEHPNLFELVKNNSIAELESSLVNNPSASDATNEQDISLLMLAVYYRNQEAINTIKKFKKNLSPWEAACLGDGDQLNTHLKSDPLLINTASPDGFSLLGYACFFGQKPIAELLVKEGADVNAASKNAIKVAPLHSAAAISNYGLCKLLLDNGANVNAAQQAGYTPLHEAAHNGKTDLAKMFLEYGADKNLLTEKGESALDLAKSKSHEETALLIQNFQRS
jgi:ankyrin repeat protein